MTPALWVRRAVVGPTRWTDSPDFVSRRRKVLGFPPASWAPLSLFPCFYFHPKGRGLVPLCAVPSGSCCHRSALTPPVSSPGPSTSPRSGVQLVSQPAFSRPHLHRRQRCPDAQPRTWSCYSLSRPTLTSFKSWLEVTFPWTPFLP